MPEFFVPSVTIAALRALLSAMKIPFSKWRKGAFKTLKQLMGNLRSGEVELRVIKTSKNRLRLLLSSTKVKIEIYSDADPDGQLRYLVEEDQILNGHSRTRPVGRSVSEKGYKGEKLKALITRALASELGLDFTKVPLPDFYIYGRYKKKPTPSKSWPGLLSGGHRIRVVCVFGKDLYNPDGYQEKDGTRMEGHHTWRLAAEVWDMAPLVHLVSNP